MTTYVIVGAGLAGAKAAEALREKAATATIVLIGDEDEVPYERPPLSKDYLMDKADRDSAAVHPVSWYAEQRIDLRMGVRATAIDAAAHTVTLSTGESVTYDKLLLATGSSSRRLTIPGTDAGGVLYLRRLDESDRIKSTLASATNLVVIGAGWIGLEVTAAARQAGVEVTVLETAPLPLLRVLGPELAQVFADLHTEHGVTFRFGVGITRLTVADGAVTGVELSDGTTVPADAVLIGVGAVPNLELATSAGLNIDNGVVVDAGLRSSDPDIFAAGDIAREDHPVLNRPIRVEHWANALNQPAVAAASMAGEDASYDELPYFFTDQYDLGMEYVGYVEPGDYDRVVFRGDLASREFIAFWLKDDRVLAGMNVNVWDVVDAVKALILADAAVDVERLTDTDVPLDLIVADLAATS